MINHLLKKHGLPDTIKIRFLEVDPNLPTAIAASTVNNILIYPKFFHFDDIIKISMIEHEIGHLISHDAEYGRLASDILKHPLLIQEYDLLVEQRADIHSAIQSLANAYALAVTRTTRYPEKLRTVEIKKHTKAIKQCSDPQTKKILQKEMKDLKSKPTYDQELLDYMIKKHLHNTPPLSSY